MNTQEAVYNMICENTGRHFLDSGGAYGRHWERNQTHTIEDFIKSPKIVMTPKMYGERLELDVTKSLFHHLCDNLEYDEYLDRLWITFDSLHKDTYWDGQDGTMNMFYQLIRRKRGRNRKWNYWQFEGEHYSGYTYNDENILSQDFVYYVMGEYVFIQSHNGCDARGGFSTPHLFIMGEGLLNYSDYILSCSEGHYHDFAGGYETTEEDIKLDKCECINYDDLSEEEKSIFDNKGIQIVPDNQMNLIPDVRKFIPYNLGKIVYKESQDDSHNTIYCSTCGLEMFVDCFN